MRVKDELCHDGFVVGLFGAVHWNDILMLREEIPTGGEDTRMIQRSVYNVKGPTRAGHVHHAHGSTVIGRINRRPSCSKLTFNCDWLELMCLRDSGSND